LRWLSQQLEKFAGRNPIILVFVHGWKYNALPSDQNLVALDIVLEQTARAEAEVGSERPVIGIFVGWRGLSIYGAWLTNLTFWNRKTAALRVALGSVRDLFGRLRQFRQRRDKDSTLVVVGHSFGGLIVYSALAQSLVELAPFSEIDHIEPSFANLVLLVNPAFEAARYMPVFSLIEHNAFAKQPPIMISITASNDSATGLAFPIGAWLGSTWDHGRNKRQRQTVVHTMGHIPWMRTHSVTLEQSDASPTAAASPPRLAAERGWSDQSYNDRVSRWERHFDGGAVLRHLALDPNNPFWIVEASPQIVNGHNGIYMDPFLGLIRKLVAEQSAATTKRGRRIAETYAEGAIRPSLTGPHSTK
jgi:pimeloyl-ACP methyl ester carboxylesterase